MEEKTVHVIMPKQWNVDKEKYTLSDIAFMNVYMNEKQKKMAEAEKNKKPIEFFQLGDIIELYKYEEVPVKDPRKAYANFYLDNRTKKVVEMGKILVFLGVKSNGRVVQLQYPSHTDNYNHYTDAIYDHVHSHPEILGITMSKIEETPSVSSASSSSSSSTSTIEVLKEKEKL
jgi:hypothetical protein